MRKLRSLLVLLAGLLLVACSNSAPLPTKSSSGSTPTPTAQATNYPLFTTAPDLTITLTLPDKPYVVQSGQTILLDLTQDPLLTPWEVPQSANPDIVAPLFARPKTHEGHSLLAFMAVNPGDTTLYSAAVSACPVTASGASCPVVTHYFKANISVTGTHRHSGEFVATSTQKDFAYSLQVGDKIHLDLGPNYHSFADSDSSVLTPPADLSTLLPGSQPAFVASGAGKSILSATFAPACLSLKPPCATATFVYHLVVKVKK